MLGCLDWQIHFGKGILDMQQADLRPGQHVVQPSCSSDRPEAAKGRRRKGKAVAASAMPAEMSAYEQMREDNIRKGSYV